MKKLVLVIGLASLASACSWVKPTTRSQAVALLQPNQVQNCRKLGMASVETVGRVILARDPKNVENELVTLAKNEAAILKGDSVVAETEIDKGKQDFGIYKCR